MAAKDYYALLGVAKGASEKEIKQAYRRLARRYHPDVNPGHKAMEEKFKEINEAYEVLSDPEKRRKYDQFGANWQYAEQFARSRGVPVDFGDSFWSDVAGGRRSRSGGGVWESNPSGGGLFHSEEPAFSDDLDDLLSRIFRQGKVATAARGEDIEYPMEVTLEEAFEGTTRILEIGVGEVCSLCRGQGSLYQATCHACNGSGMVRRPRRLEVKIPPGVREGSRVRIAGEGKASPDGLRGDLYLVMSVKSHPRFQRQGDDLSTETEVPLTELMLGGEVEVATLKGKVALKIPPETQNGQTFRLSGQGMPHLGNSGRGDLLVKIKAVLPSNLSPRETELLLEWQQLKKRQQGNQEGS